MTSLKEAVGQEQSGLKAICLEMNLPGHTTHLHVKAPLSCLFWTGSLLVLRGSRVHWKDKKESQAAVIYCWRWGGRKGDGGGWQGPGHASTCQPWQGVWLYPKSQVKPLNGVKCSEVWWALQHFRGKHHRICILKASLWRLCREMSGQRRPVRTCWDPPGWRY